MAIDPNIYALSIELSLNASDAFDTLNDFEESLLDIEEQIVDAAKSAIGKIDNLVSDVDSSIRKLSASILDLSSNTVDIAKSVAGSGIDGIHTSIDMAVESADKLRGVLDSAGESSVSHFTQLNQELVGISDSVANSGIDGIYQSVDSAVESTNRLRGVLDSAGVESVDKFTQLNQKFREISGSVADSGIGGMHRSVDLAIESANSLRDTISSTGDMTIDKFDELRNSVDAIADSAGNIKLSAFEDNIGLAERTVDIVDSISFENQLSQLSDAENVVDGIASKYRMITSSDFGPTVSYLDTMSSRLNDILLVINKSSNSFRQLLSTMEDSNSRLSMIYVGQDASFKNLLSTMESGNDKLLLTYTGQNTAFSDLSDSMSSTTDNFSNAISVNRRDIVKLFSDTAEYGGEIFLIYDNILDDTNSISSNIDDQLVNMKKQYDFIVETNDIYDKMKKFEDDETDNLIEHLKLFTDIYEAIEIKNKEHEEEIGLVQSEIPYIEQAVEAFDRQRDAVGGVARSQFSLYNVMRQVFDLMRMLDEETENFVTSNYRAYGSQQQIVQQSRLLSAEYGILRDVSLEAYKVLGDLKVPRDQLDKYALAVAQASRFTGLGVTELAEYAGRMRQVGFDAADMQRQMLFASYAMRTFGLSAKDLSTVLGGTSISAAQLEMIFRGEDQAEKYDRMKMVFTGLAGQLGYTADQANAFFNNLNDPIERAKFEQFAGMSISSVEDLSKAMIVAGGKVKDEYGAISEAVENGLDPAHAQIRFKALAQAYGFGTVEAMEMAMAIEKQSAAMGLNVDNITDLQQALEIMQAAAIDPYAEANDSLTAQLRILRDEGVALIGYFIQPAIDIFKEFLKVVNYVIQSFTSVISAIRRFVVFLENLWIIGPIVKLVVWLTKTLGSLVFVIGLVLASALLLSGGLRGLFDIFGAFFTRLAAQIPVIGNNLVIFFQTIGRVIAAFLDVVEDVAVRLTRIVGNVLISLFRSLGTALLYLGNSVRTVMVPLIALGFALMMTGAGAYMFAKSVAVIADVGWAAIPAMLGMIAAIGVLGLVLVGLGHLAIAAAPGLLAIGATLLVVGAGAMALGYGVRLAAEAFKIFVDSVKKVTDGELIQKFATELRAAAWNLMIAGPLLLVASTTLLPASVMLLAAGIALSTALYFFSGIDESLVKTGEIIKSFAMSLADASAYFDKVSISSIMFAMTALTALSIGVGVLGLALVGLGYLAIAAAPGLLAIGATLLMAGAGAMAFGYGIRLAAEAFKIFADVAKQVIDNKSMLKLAVELKAAIPAMFGMVAAIGVLGLALVGLGYLAIAAAPGLLAIGATLLIVGAGAMALGYGVKLAAEAFKIFTDSIKQVTDGELIRKFVDAGLDAIPIMFGMVAAIGVLGLALVGIGYFAIAAVPGLLAIGATLLMIGAGAMAFGYGIRLAAEAFKIFTDSIKQVTDGELIRKFASELRAASLDLIITGPLLLAAGAMMLPASIMLLTAGMSLLPASVVLLAAGVALSTALYFFSGIGESLIKIGETIKSFAMLFADASIYFGKTSISSIASAMTALTALALGISAAWLFFPTATTESIGKAIQTLGVGFKELSVGLATIESSNVRGVYDALSSVSGMIDILNELSLDGVMVNIDKLKIIGPQIAAASGDLFHGAAVMNTSSVSLSNFGNQILNFSENIVGAIPKLADGATLLIYVADRLKYSAFELLIASMDLLPSTVMLEYVSDRLRYSAFELLTSAMYLMPSAIMLEYAGNALIGSAASILFAVNAIDGSVSYLLDISASLVGVGGMLITAGLGMVTGSTALVVGSSVLIGSSVAMTAAGLALIPAAISLSTGLYFMSGALERFLWITGTLNTISASIMLLSTSFRELSTINFGVIDDILAPSVSALPLIDEFAAGISTAANKLNEAVNKFKGPADTLVTTLQNMKSAVDNIGFSGINVGDEMAVVGAKLEEYSALLQQTAERVEIAINSKAIPAIRNAEASGINDAIKSEAISTVQVMDKTEGSEINSKSENLLEAQNALLNKIVELIDSISSKDRTKNLYDLIEQYLGSSPNSESGLISNNLNQWAGS